jgi:hypothetical protein
LTAKSVDAQVLQSLSIQQSDTGLFTLSLMLNYSLALSVTEPSSTQLTVHGFATLDSFPSPLDASSALSLQWFGQVTASSPSIFIKDANSFDGVPPAVLLNPISPTGQLDSQASYVQDIVGKITLRTDTFTTAPSSLLGTSTRGLFLSSQHLAAITSSVSMDGELWTPSSGRSCSMANEIVIHCIC